jgi:hypothetical protein
MGTKVNKNIRNLPQNDRNNLKITLDEKQKKAEREEKKE